MSPHFDPSPPRHASRPDHASRPHSGRRWTAAVAQAPIAGYQRFISPALPRRCKYEPTCSRYAVQAIGVYGVPRGLALAVWRVLRCNPFSHGGYDPVEAQQVFATHSPKQPHRPRHPHRPHTERPA